MVNSNRMDDIIYFCEVRPIGMEDAVIFCWGEVWAEWILEFRVNEFDEYAGFLSPKSH